MKFFRFTNNTFFDLKEVLSIKSFVNRKQVEIKTKIYKKVKR